MKNRKEVKVTCYGSLHVFKDKWEALHFFTECFLNSEGAERVRYDYILNQILANFKNINDEEMF